MVHRSGYISSCGRLWLWSYTKVQKALPSVDFRPCPSAWRLHMGHQDFVCFFSIAFVAVSRYDWGVHVPRWCRRRVSTRKDHIQGIKHESFPASCTLFVLVDALIACVFWETRTTTETQIGAQMCQWLSVNGVILAGRRSYSSFLLAWSICQCWGRHWWFGAPVELHVMIQIAVTPCPFLWTISCCHVPPGFVNSSDMPEAIKLNVMSSGISLDRCLSCVTWFSGLAVWPLWVLWLLWTPKDVLSWFWLDSQKWGLQL